MIARVAVLLAACAFLSGCGSASMRIQVDVYKGPLANTEAIQREQLSSIIDSIDDALLDMDRQLESTMCAMECESNHLGLTNDRLAKFLPGKGECTVPPRGSTRQDFNTKEKEQGCPLLTRMRGQVHALFNNVCGEPPGPGVVCDNATFKPRLDWSVAGSFLQDLQRTEDLTGRLPGENAICSNDSNPEACKKKYRLAMASLARVYSEVTDLVAQNSDTISVDPVSVPAALAHYETLSDALGDSIAQMKSIDGRIREILDTPGHRLADLQEKYRAQKRNAVKLSASIANITPGLGKSLAVLPTVITPTAAQQLYKEIETWQAANDLVPSGEMKQFLTAVEKVESDTRKGVVHVYLQNSRIDYPDTSTAIATIQQLERDAQTLRAALLASRAQREGLSAAMTARKTEGQRFDTAKKTLDSIASEIAAQPDSAAQDALYAAKTGAIVEALDTMQRSLETARRDGGSFLDLAAAEGALPTQRAAVVSGKPFNTINPALQVLSIATSEIKIDKAATDKLRSDYSNAAVAHANALTAVATEISTLRKNIDSTVAVIQPIALDAKGELLHSRLRTAKATFAELSNSLSQAKKSVDAERTFIQRVRDEADNQTYGKIGGLAADFRILAAYLSYQIAAVEPRSKRVRIDVAKLANLSAELANQLASRANALSVQTGSASDAGVDRAMLSTGQYLRDSQPTAFVELYDWLDAATGSKKSVKNRVEIAKQLFDDDNWGGINEVYASGSGSVSMAFIRDDIGNWNLKSFENNPSELAAAFTDVTLDLLEKATNSASPAAAITTAQQALAGDVSGSELRSAELFGSLDMTSVRRDTLERMKKIFEEASAEKTRIEMASFDDPGPLEEKTSDLNSDMPDHLDQFEAIKKTALQDLSKTTKAKLAVVANDYTRLVEALQRVVVADEDSKKSESN